MACFSFELKLIDIIREIKKTYDKLEGRLKAEGFKVRVLRTLKAWEDTIYPKDFMNRLHNIFLGLEEQVRIYERVLTTIIRS